MKNYRHTIGVLLLCTAFASPANADRGCSIRDVAGKWVFATGIGQQNLDLTTTDGDITAIGTMNISRDGSLEGTFDFTVFGEAFVEGFPYWGTIVVNADCTGSIELQTPASHRKDSIVIVNRGEMIGMSQDTRNLWTYQVRRIGPFLRFGR